MIAIIFMMTSHMNCMLVYDDDENMYWMYMDLEEVCTWVHSFSAPTSEAPMYIIGETHGLRHPVRLLSAHINTKRGLSREWGIHEENNS